MEDVAVDQDNVGLFTHRNASEVILLMHRIGTVEGIGLQSGNQLDPLLWIKSRRCRIAVQFTGQRAVDALPGIERFDRGVGAEDQPGTAVQQAVERVGIPPPLSPVLLDQRNITGQVNGLHAGDHRLLGK